MSPCNTCDRPPLATYTPLRRSLKQSLLGASLDGQLCIEPPSISPPITNYVTQKGSSIHKPPITQLSNELLHKICTYALEEEPCSWRSTFFQRALRLSKVSRRFHCTVQPLMYRAIDLSNHELVPLCIAVKLLHRTIKGKPALGSMVRRLSVHVEYKYLVPALVYKFNIGRELLGFVPNVESFSVSGGHELPATWPMIKSAVKNWPRIKHISLMTSLLTTPVWELILATPSLRTMYLEGTSANFEFSNNTSRPMRAPKDTERTSNITGIHIQNFTEGPDTLQNLLKLPRALEHFKFGTIYSNPVQWRLDMFQWLLADHRKTLKSIEIGIVHSGDASITFMEYPNLERLHLSHWMYRETAETAAASILAPRLHTFIWDFGVYDQHSEGWFDFNEPQKEWLLRFAELAAARKSALKKIEIIFHPDSYDEPIKTREELAACVTPWDMMDEVKAKIRPLGMELEYNECWTREECLQRIEQAALEELDEVDS